MVFYIQYRSRTSIQLNKTGRIVIPTIKTEPIAYYMLVHGIQQNNDIVQSYSRNDLDPNNRVQTRCQNLQGDPVWMDIPVVRRKIDNNHNINTSIDKE